MVMNPEFRKRLINSMKFLKEMDFFKEYSNLSSEEILEKIFNGEIDYEAQWFVEEWPEEMRRKVREGRKTHGQTFKELLEEREDYWMKASDSEIDLELAFFDIKRAFIEHTETVIGKGIGRVSLEKLARISRGFFNPIYVGEEVLDWKGKPPPALKRARHSTGCIFKVAFKFKGKDQLVEFYSDADYLYMDPAMEKINELIKDTGYQYYDLHDPDYIVYAVFSSDEAEKLTRRGWHLSLPKVNQDP